MSGAGDVPNFSFTIAGVDQLSPPYYIDAVRTSTNKLRYYVESPYFASMARSMAPYTGILLEADAVGFHIANESKRVYAASCTGGHHLTRSTLFGPMPDVAGTLDIPKPLPGATVWTTRSFRQNYDLIKATTDIMSPRADNDFESNGLLWDRAHGLMQQLLTQERIEIALKLITATQEYLQTNRPALIDGYLQTREDPNSFVNFVDGTFAHVWRDAREARRFVACSQRLWQTIMEHRVLPVLCPITVMMQSRGRSITFTPLMPLHGTAVDAELAPSDILRLFSSLIGNTGGHHRFGQATAKVTATGEVEDLADVTDQPLAAPAHAAGMFAGADGYYYITRPTAFGIILEHLRGGKTIAVPYAPLRFEAYQRVFPDGLSKERGWTANQAVERIVSTAFEPVVKTLVKRARSKVTDLVQRGFVTALFRQYGLNIRFAFLVLREALTHVNPRTPEEMAITDALEAEMLCRAMKTMYRADVAISTGVMTDDDYLEKANRLLYYINSGSRPIWEQMSTVVRGKFIGCPPEYNIPPSPKLARILTWFMTPKMGFNFDPEQGLFDKVSAAMPVWYGCYTQPESIRLSIAGKLDAAASALGQQWQWLEGIERPPIMEYQKAIEVGRWKKINTHLAPEDPYAQEIAVGGERMDMSVTHQHHRSQVFELLSHSVRVLSLTRLCQIDDEVVRMRLVKVLDTALRYRNVNSAVFAHLCSLLIDYLSFEAKEASVTHPIAEIFEDTCRTVYFYGTRLVQSMCINFAKIQGSDFEGTRTGNLFFISQALMTAGKALNRDAAADNAKYRPYSATVQAAIGVETDAPALYDYSMKARTALKLKLKASRGAQYMHAGMTLRLHYHIGRLTQIANRVLSRPRIIEHTPAYIDFRVNPDLLTEVLALSNENITLKIASVALLTHQSHMLGSHLYLKETQRQEFVSLSKTFFAQKKDQRRFVTDDLFVGLSMAAFQYHVDIPCKLTDEEIYSDAEVVTCFTRLLAASLFAVEQADSKLIAPIIDCHKAVNRVYPTKVKATGLFFNKQDFDLIKSSIQSPMFARNLSNAMDDVLLVRRMWVVLNTIRQVYYKGGIIYAEDEDLDEAVSVADWCNKMADVQRAYAYRRLNGRFPDDTPQRSREIDFIKQRLWDNADLYVVGMDHMERLIRHAIENKHIQSHEEAARRTMDRESDEWLLAFHTEVFEYKQLIGVRTCQMEEFFARNAIEKDEAESAETLLRDIYAQIRTYELKEQQSKSDTSAAVMYCDAYLEPYNRNQIEIEQVNAIAKIITTTYYCYAYMPAIYKNGYMRSALKSYEDSIVHGAWEQLLRDENTEWVSTLDSFNAGYFGDAMGRLFAKEADLRKRMIIHERATFNVGVFTPIENMSRQLVMANERLEWLQLIEHPHQRLTECINPETGDREAIEEEQVLAFATHVFNLSLKERFEIEIQGELQKRMDTLCPIHEQFERFAFVENEYVNTTIYELLVPMEEERRFQLFDVEHSIVGREEFLRFMIEEELRCTDRDLLLQLATHRKVDVLGAEQEAEFLAIYDRYQIESGQFRAADFEEYESVLRGELNDRYLLECITDIIVSKSRDLGAIYMKDLTEELLVGLVEREDILRREMIEGIPAAERELYMAYMEAFAAELEAVERWARGRFMSVHELILDEYNTRTDTEVLEQKRFRGITMACELMMAQLRGLDAIGSNVQHPALNPIVARHWPRVVAEQRHADANALNCLPYDNIATSHGSPIVALIAQRQVLKMMAEVMPEQEYDEIRFYVEECVRRGELIEWYGHFVATARAEFENTFILMTERVFPDALPLLVCIPTAASLNVAPLLPQPGHVVSRITGHARRLILTAGFEMQRVHKLEVPVRAAMAKRHSEMLVELRKPPHRRSKRVLQGLGNARLVSLAPVLETGLLPILPAEVPEAIHALSIEQFHLLKLLLYEDSLPVEMTLRLRLQIVEHRTAMGLYRTMKEAEACLLSKPKAATRPSFWNPTNPDADAMRNNNVDLSLIPPSLIQQAKAIADGRFYHTAADSDEEIGKGPFIRAPPPTQAPVAGYRRGKRSGADEEDRDKMDGAEEDNAPIDPTKLPTFRVFEDCYLRLLLPGYSARPSSGLRRPGSSGARRSRPNSASLHSPLSINIRPSSASTRPPTPLIPSLAPAHLSQLPALVHHTSTSTSAAPLVTNVPIGGTPIKANKLGLGAIRGLPASARASDRPGTPPPAYGSSADYSISDRMNQSAPAKSLLLSPLRGQPHRKGDTTPNRRGPSPAVSQPETVQTLQPVVFRKKTVKPQRLTTLL